MVTQQLLQTLCLLSSCPFTRSFYQTIIVLIFFTKSCMSTLHWHVLSLNHLGKGVLGNVVPDFCPVMQRRVCNWVLVTQILQKIRQAYTNLFSSPPPPINTHDSILDCCILPSPIHIFWRSFSVVYTVITLLAVVTCPPQRLY